MKAYTILLLGITSFILLSCVAAETKNGGVLNTMLELIKTGFGELIGLLQSIIGQEKQEAGCEPPYILSGSQCCLDLDNTGICDRDEVDSTTTTHRTTTTTAIMQETTTTIQQETTTTQGTTTTAPPEIACYVNSDCGQMREERVCYKGDVYRQRITPTCRNPGTVDAICIETQRFVGATLLAEPTPDEICSEGCKDGACL